MITFREKKKYSPDVVELNLHDKGLIEVPNDINNFTKLQGLNLSSNKINIFKGDVFKSLLDFRNLKLSFNKINEIEEETFNSLANLQRLDLSYNKINGK
jgi:Leucine-rich repeat (LRR) protein